ncbi:ABC transporter transmembrane domain-containing protein [Hyphococcus sp.]|uniref:ABC transporter transmembrane domain-containing protein n=1 Tax=Hyphococcus sp. TaxID=2038636 RepID=UPI003D0E494A
MTLSKMFGLFVKILGPEKNFFILTIIYGIGISFLSLATPISVQMLINTVANTGLATPLVVLSLTLFLLLLVSGLLNALRVHLMEIFSRRFYARMVSEISIRSLYAQNPFFGDDGRASLFNRYFDIITVQKNIPVLLIGGFTLILQAGVGFALVSFYHPLFLAFNIILICLIWFVWVLWGKAAIREACELSHRKHATAAWLEGLGASNGYFKSEMHIAYALTKTDAATSSYIDAHRRHFRRHFSQTISFFVIYAAASATLLGLGGWLVIQGQLSIGQLVAAELILSAAFFGVSQLGAYLNYFYDLCAALDELSLFYDVAQEEPKGSHLPTRHDSTLVFAKVRGDARGSSALLDFRLDNGAAVMARAENHGIQRLVCNLLKRHEKEKGGYITLGGRDIRDTEIHALRQEIIVLDRPMVIESTIRDYLRLSAGDAEPETILEALRAVGLERVIVELEYGLDTKIASTGWPLSVAETMQLKLASALLARPRVLILNQLFDVVCEDHLTTAIRALRDDPHTTLIYFSNRKRDLGFDEFLFLGLTRQRFYESIESLAFAEVDRRNTPCATGEHV